MSRTNIRIKTPPVYTHEGARAPHTTPLQQLRRSVLGCLLWEKEFYEDGAKIADRIRELAAKVKPVDLASLAVQAREEYNLRHVPLLLAVELVRNSRGRSDQLVPLTVAMVVQRADEMAELLSIYWGGGTRTGKHPLANVIKKGLALALTTFDEYQLAKYDRDGGVRLRDVIRLAHPVPKDKAQRALWGRAVRGELRTPDTWDTELSAGKDKKATFERLIREKKLGYLALLRNLRNMVNADVDRGLIEDAIRARKGGAERVFPFRFVAAARAVPQLEPVLDEALLANIAGMASLPGTTALLVDVSGSMDERLSAKSDMTRMDAAATLASVFPGTVRVFTFSNSVVEVPPRKGMAGVDAIVRSQPHGGTNLGSAIAHLNKMAGSLDRLVVITDEQSHDRVPDPEFEKAYMINVASNRNGVGYGKWTHIDGFSEAVVRFIVENERD